MKRLIWAIAPLLLAAGCDLVDTGTDKDGTVDTGPTDTGPTDTGPIDTGPIDTGPIDADGDGFTADVDCDDSNAGVHPDAEEICDRVDNDCDGAIDEDDATDAGTWYGDADGDEYGDASSQAVACEAPSGFVADDTDCDDTDADFHPGADEDDCADPNDYNCDGSLGYEDLDGDGFAACEDCDDNDATANDNEEETCDGVDNDCNGAVDDDATDATTWYADSDGDTYGGTQFTTAACTAPPGYVANASDCNDLSPVSYPGAAEICDLLDNDCDGTIDEGALYTWYADADGDGYGDASSGADACSLPPGYSSNGDDCDDTNPSIHPGSYEICDGADNNCDGTVDEDSAINASTWYTDSDGDGYGDSSNSTASCSQPGGTSALGGDCDDSNSAISPTAIEYCDAVDNDCDGNIDEDDAIDAATWYADTDGDGYGAANASTTSCVMPTAYVSDDTDCDDTNGSAHPNATEVCDGADNDCNGLADDDDPGVDGSTQTLWYVDADADGYGVPGASEQLCTQPSGTADNDSDCDDTDSTINPTTPWYADSDADGFGDPSASTNSCTQPSGYVSDSADCDDTDALANPDTEWFLDSDGDGYGDATNSLQSCTQPSGYVGDPTDCDDSDPNSGFCILEEVNFTTCGATGSSGPSQGDCNSAYGGSTLDGDVSVSSGIQSWTVVTTGNYVITAVGADGGDNSDHGYIGGFGASMEGTFSLTAGQVLEIVVGQSGTNGSDDAGGGGGSFVVVQGASTPLIAAGGGGGGAENDDNSTSLTTYKNGVTGTCGQDAPRHGGGTNPGGCSGNGGSNDPNQYGQGAGAGYLTDGDNGSSNYCNGRAFVNGAEGCSNGGFGGGGHGGGDGGGGAGGYSGGAGGSGGGGPDGPGGGGGSFNAGTNQNNSDGANTGAGYVTIVGA